MTDRIGQTFGNFKLTRLLGKGGFAEVYLGENLYIQSQKAIKILHAHFDQAGRDLFLTEARTVARLVHPHIVQIHDFGIEGAIPYIVMDYASQGSLALLHTPSEQLPFATVLAYIQQIAAALQYAHDQQLVHRDVKPANMLLTIDGKLLLGDFGIATIAHRTQSLQTQQPCGTALYMAPEQIHGRPRRASDQYSLAVVAYEWLCGFNPFAGTSTIDIALHHINNTPKPLRATLPHLLPGVENAILKALAKQPEDRFGSVQEFTRALEIATQHQLASTKQSHGSSFSPAQPSHSAVVLRGTSLSANQPAIPGMFAQQTTVVSIQPTGRTTQAQLRPNTQKKRGGSFATLLNAPFKLVEGVLAGPLLFSLPAALLVPLVLWWKSQSWVVGVGLSLCSLALFNWGKNARRFSVAILLGILYGVAWGSLGWLFQPALLDTLKTYLGISATQMVLPLSICAIGFVGCCFHTFGFSAYIRARQKKRVK